MTQVGRGRIRIAVGDALVVNIVIVVVVVVDDRGRACVIGVAFVVVFAVVFAVDQVSVVVV